MPSKKPRGEDDRRRPSRIRPDKIDTSQPIIMNVGRQGDAVLFQFGEVVIGVPVATAQQWAERVLAEVAAIKGVEHYTLSMGGITRTIRKAPPNLATLTLRDADLDP